VSLLGKWAEGVQDQCVSKELNTLLTALYVLIDDHVVASRVGRGRQPLMGDCELITLAVAQVMLGYHRERRWIRHLHSSPEWRSMFPSLLNQSGYHKRLKNAQRLLALAAGIWHNWTTNITSKRSVSVVAVLLGGSAPGSVSATRCVVVTGRGYN
jgi:hypothetical protein